MTESRRERATAGTNATTLAASQRYTRHSNTQRGEGDFAALFRSWTPKSSADRAIDALNSWEFSYKTRLTGGEKRIAGNDKKMTNISKQLPSPMILIVLLWPLLFGGCGQAQIENDASSKSDAPATNVRKEMYLRVCDIGMAYSAAANKLGRSPKSLSELKTFLTSQESVVSLRDGKPFEIQAVENVNVGGPKDRMLVWESTPDKNGQRYVFQESQGGYRVGKDEFQSLRDGTWTRERWLPRKPLSQLTED